MAARELLGDMVRAPLEDEAAAAAVVAAAAADWASLRPANVLRRGAHGLGRRSVGADGTRSQMRLTLIKLHLTLIEVHLLLQRPTLKQRASCMLHDRPGVGRPGCMPSRCERFRRRAADAVHGESHRRTFPVAAKCAEKPGRSA